MRSIAALIFLFSTQAFACPDLSGTYSCKLPDGSTERSTVTQSVRPDGVTIYDYNGTEVIADGVTYSIPEDDTIREGSFRAWCGEEGTMNAEMTARYFSNGKEIGILTLGLVVSSSGIELKESTVGNLKNSSGAHPLDSEIVCTRLKN